MKYLIDTNILLEVLLQQARAQEVKQFLNLTPHSELAFSDFSMHSIGVRLYRLKLHAVYEQLLNDLFLRGGARWISLPLSDAPLARDASLQYGLDFDDAYQYALAELYNLTIVSFDADFDRTPRGRKEPRELTPFP